MTLEAVEHHETVKHAPLKKKEVPGGYLLIIDQYTTVFRPHEEDTQDQESVYEELKALAADPEAEIDPVLLDFLEPAQRAQITRIRNKTEA